MRDTKGAVLVEYTIVFPLFIILVFGTVDVTYMFYDWVLANKAAYVGGPHGYALRSGCYWNNYSNLRSDVGRPALL